MNTPNNRRRRASQRKIEDVFIEMLQDTDFDKLTVTEICKRAHVNRTTFYACYEDLYDLASKVMLRLWQDIEQVYADEGNNLYTSYDFLPLFKYIYQHQRLFRTCFKLGAVNLPIQKYDEDYASQFFHDDDTIMYHIEFFRAGFNRVMQIWLDGGCKETPEEINNVIRSEYEGRPH